MLELSVFGSAQFPIIRCWLKRLLLCRNKPGAKRLDACIKACSTSLTGLPVFVCCASFAALPAHRTKALAISNSLSSWPGLPVQFKHAGCSTTRPPPICAPSGPPRQVPAAAPARGNAFWSFSMCFGIFPVGFKIPEMP